MAYKLVYLNLIFKIEDWRKDMPLQYKLEYIHELLIKHNGVKKKVAEELGKDPANMKKYWRLLRDKGLLDKDFNLIL